MVLLLLIMMMMVCPFSGFFLQEHRIKNSGSVDDIDDADSAQARIISFDFCCQKIYIGTISIFQYFLAPGSDKSDNWL